MFQLKIYQSQMSHKRTQQSITTESLIEPISEVIDDLNMISVKELSAADLPDISYLNVLGLHEYFSLFVAEHRNLAERLIDQLLGEYLLSPVYYSGSTQGVWHRD